MQESTTTPWTALYPPGVPSDLSAGVETMLDAWDRTLTRLGPDAPAVHFGDRTLTLGQIDTESEALAAALRDMGMRAGDNVAVQLQNDPQWLIALLAVWKSGGAAVAVNPMLREDELAHLLSDSRARFLVCLEELLPLYEPIRDRTGVRAVITTTPADLDPTTTTKPPSTAADVHPWREAVTTRRGALVPRPPLTGDSLALLTYTSGTTGPAKGALNLHRCVAHSAGVFASWFSLDERDTVLGIAPLFHITGSVAGMSVTILTGAPLVLLHRFDAGETLAAIERHGATFTVAAATAFVALLDHPDVRRRDLSSLTKTGSGGAAVSPALAERVQTATGWRIQGVYGMTETTSPTHICPPGHTPPVDPASGALSVGIPVPGAQVRVVDSVTGEPLPPGGEGEIAVRGPMVVPGYWDAPEESSYALRGGWLHTGDIGVMDERGWLFVVDRKKDLINAGGFKVWPREVEDVLYQHPAVREAAVVGVPDAYRGETVKAYITLVSGASATESEIIAFARERMAAYKYPRHVELLEDLPKTASGKLLRRALRHREEQT
ncbi:AMP-binding protein [Streptomyces sp. NPDC012616]|uniref:class I adenylate-forming enzyme family protein n=1 Tax=Streptomyces sp. NPDC012616 TaxID=3364840 RepID=UPI0036ED01F7